MHLCIQRILKNESFNNRQESNYPREWSFSIELSGPALQGLYLSGGVCHTEKKQVRSQ